MMKRRFISIAMALVFVLAVVPFAGAAKAADDGLVAHFTFDSDLSDQVTKKTPTKLGDVTIADEGVIGKSAKFGKGYLDVSDFAAFNLGDNFTVAAWVKLDAEPLSAAAERPIVGGLHRAGADGSYFSYYFQPRGKVLEACVRTNYLDTNNPSHFYTASATYESWVEKWTHVAMKCDGKRIMLYIDGKMESVKDIDDPGVSATVTAIIGKGAGYDHYFAGLMDDLRVYSIAVDDSVIAGLADLGGAYAHKMVMQIGSNMMIVDDLSIPVDPADKGVAPYIESGRTLVPVRVITETMGGTAKWMPEERKVELAIGGTVINMWLDMVKATVNGKEVTFDVPIRSLGGRTYVPLRFVAENFGAHVEWDGLNKRITLLYN